MKGKAGDSMGRNRRKHERIEINLMTDFKGDDDSASYRSCIKDISEGGVCVILDHELQLHTEVHINFSIPVITKKSIKVSGKVVWGKAIENEKGFAHGIALTDVPETYEEIIQYVRSLVYDIRHAEITTT